MHAAIVREPDRIDGIAAIDRADREGPGIGSRDRYTHVATRRCIQALDRGYVMPLTGAGIEPPYRTARDPVGTNVVAPRNPQHAVPANHRSPRKQAGGRTSKDGATSPEETTTDLQ